MYASTACHRGEFSHANAMSTVRARTSLTQKKDLRLKRKEGAAHQALVAETAAYHATIKGLSRKIIKRSNSCCQGSRN